MPLGRILVLSLDVVPQPGGLIGLYIFLDVSACRRPDAIVMFDIFEAERDLLLGLNAVKLHDKVVLGVGIKLPTKIQPAVVFLWVLFYFEIEADGVLVVFIG